MNNYMNNLIQKINSGKARGYYESKPCDGKIYYVLYAVRKKNSQYMAYFFSVDESEIDAFEDYAYEEIMQFDNLYEAFSFLKEKGADIKKFQAFKGASPL
jgi:hypothetical protein